jgi:outer membrane lipoprotein-sorting protein
MNKLKNSKFFPYTFCVFFLFYSSIVFAQDKTEVSINDIVTILKKNYESFVSYSDRGSLENPLSKIDFETYFIRPDRFRFTWTKYITLNPGAKNRSDRVEFKKRYSVLTDGIKTYWVVYAQNNGKAAYTQKNSLREAIVQATGISFGSIKMISSLFINNIYSKTLTSMHYKNKVREEIVADVVCYHIETLEQDGYLTEVWIDKENKIIKKIREKFPDGFSNTIIFNEIVVNSTINPSAFEKE